jgi:hypothetical protein
MVMWEGGFSAGTDEEEAARSDAQVRREIVAGHQRWVVDESVRSRGRAHDRGDRRVVDDRLASLDVGEGALWRSGRL